MEAASSEPCYLCTKLRDVTSRHVTSQDHSPNICHLKNLTFPMFIAVVSKYLLHNCSHLQLLLSLDKCEVDSTVLYHAVFLYNNVEDLISHTFNCYHS